MRPVVRSAEFGDLATLLAIYNDAVTTTTASYDYEPRSDEGQRVWFAAKQEAGYPVLVAVADGAVLGFASYGIFRAWAGYRFTIEHSVYVERNARGRGVGRALLEPLIARASADGYHMMIGGIDATNDASLRLHAALGFAPAGTLREVGRKFDRWLDLVLVQKWLGPAGESPA
jgi:phosphinothricin acetyltransferase